MTERMNMLRIGVPEKSREGALAFDAEKEFSSELWDKLIKGTQDEYKVDRLNTFLSMAQSLAVLGHPVAVTPLLKKAVEMDADAIRRRHNTEELCELIAAAAPLGIQTPTLSLDERAAALLRLQEYRSSGLTDTDTVTSFTQFARNLKSIDRTIPVLVKEDWPKILAALAAFRTENKWSNFSTLAEAIIALDPEQLPRLTDDDWVQVRMLLHHFASGESWLNVALQARDMTVIARHEGSKRSNAKDDTITPMPATPEI